MATPYDGILLVDKEKDRTSFDMVKRIRRVLKVKKVGHAGTLDPFATGLLIILLGQGTKLSPYLMGLDKIYLGTMRLGIETDTQDLTGRVIKRRPVPPIETETIRRMASKFIGEIEQVPPVFSAVNYQGRRAYEFARKGINIALKKRTVTVHSLEILSLDLPDVTIKVSCSSGTYIRSLASGLGLRLGPGAHLISLRRLSSGPFEVKDAMNMNGIETVEAECKLTKEIIPLREALPQMAEVEVDGQMAGRVRNGYQPKWKEVDKVPDGDGPVRGHMKLVTGGELVAILRAGHNSHISRERIEIMRVFH